MQQALRAIAEPRRRDILSVLGENELSAGQVASFFDVTRPAISQHLKVLEAAGLVAVRRHGTRRLYRTRPETLEGVMGYLEGFWGDRLCRLKAAAEVEQKETG